MCIAVRSVKIIPSKYANDVLLKRHDQTTVPARQHMSVAKSSNFNAAEHMKAMHYTATSVVKGRSPVAACANARQRKQRQQHCGADVVQTVCPILVLAGTAACTVSSDLQWYAIRSNLCGSNHHSIHNTQMLK